MYDQIILVRAGFPPPNILLTSSMHSSPTTGLSNMQIYLFFSTKIRYRCWNTLVCEIYWNRCLGQIIFSFAVKELKLLSNNWSVCAVLRVQGWVLHSHHFASTTVAFDSHGAELKKELALKVRVEVRGNTMTWNLLAYKCICLIIITLWF